MENSTEESWEMSSSFIWTHSIPNRTPTLIIVSAIFLIITTLFFAARTTVRFKIHQWGWDDLMATLAYTTMLTQTSFLFVAAHHGFGKHRADIPLMFPTAMFWFWMYQIFYKILGGFTKMTFCLLYLRLFPQRVYRRVVLGVSGVIVAGSFAFMMGTIFQCSPVERNWNKRLPGTCINFSAFWYSHASFNTAMDLVVFILPLPMIRELHMTTRSRIGLASIFALGAFTIVASIIRMTALYGSASSQTDPTWGSTTALVWTEVEANTAVICCCLPALRKVAVQAWRRMLGKLGDETPIGNARSGNPPTPGNGNGAANKPFGTFTEVRHSPTGSIEQAGPSTRPRRSSRSKWKWPGMRRERRLSEIGEEDSRRVEEGSAIEMGGITRRRDFKIKSERVPQQAVQEERGNVFALTLEEFLATRGPTPGRA